MSEPRLIDPPPVGPEVSAVDFVPLWSLGLGVVSALAAVVWLLARRMPGGGVILMAFVVLAALGLTFGLCGVLLALRDGRRLSVALVGTVANLALPGLLMVGGPEGLLGE